MGMVPELGVTVPEVTVPELVFPAVAVPAVASLPVPTPLMTPVLAALPLRALAPDAPPRESRDVRAPHAAHIVATSAAVQKVAPA
jgi:hypothetical protein